MNTFLWTVVILLGIEMFGRVCWLCMEMPPQRTKHGVAIDLIAVVCMLIWAVVLLAKQ